MVVNKFMCDNIMIKNKTLPLYEQNGIYNLKKRKYKNIDTLHEYNMRTQVLTKNVRCGSLWDTIKNIFKKGSKIAKDTINYIDRSPLLNTVKDIASDYVYEKTGINPNDYYNVARDVVNSDSATNIQRFTDNAAKTLMDTYQQHKKKKPTTNSKTGQPTKREQLKTFMKDYANNLMTQVPEEKKTIKQNIDLFSSGIDEISAGGLNLDTWKKKAPLFLLSTLQDNGKGKCGNMMSDKIKDMLKNRFKIMDLKLTPTMKKLLQGNGRLYQGRGEEVSTGRLEMGRGGKKSNDKYAKILAALK